MQSWFSIHWSNTAAGKVLFNSELYQYKVFFDKSVVTVAGKVLFLNLKLILQNLEFLIHNALLSVSAL